MRYAPLSRRRQRGQSLAEAVIGLFVFLVILMLGIQGAELGFLSLKVQEAANSALWNTTLGKMHAIPSLAGADWTLYRNNLSPSQLKANKEYGDYDDLRTLGSIKNVYVQTGALQVNCRALEPVKDKVQGIAAPTEAADAFPVSDQGAVCQSTGTLTGFQFKNPIALANGIQTKPKAWKICGVGDIVAKDCGRQLAIVLDDYGFESLGEAQECPLAEEGGSTCANQGYYDLAKSVYSKIPVTNAGSASQLAALTIGESPINDEQQFYMSFKGGESAYVQKLTTSHKDLDWETTPFKYSRGNVYYNPARQNCWLGHPCL